MTPNDSPVLVAPSVMCADQACLADEVKKLEAVGVDLLHMDLMDTHFVPNMPMGLGALASLRDKTSLPFDVHLMVERNDWFIGELATIGVEQISVHAESSVHLDRTLALIREHGMKAGCALNPATPLSALDYVFDRLDFVVLMTVNPGYAGQKLVPATIGKIADCRNLLASRGLEIPIEVDGNVSFQNVPGMVAAGADILVAGTSSIYHRGGSLKENMARLKETIDAGCATRGAGA